MPTIQDAIVPLLSAFSGGLLGALLNRFFDWRVHRRRGNYLAIRLSVMLEEYAVRCADMASEHDMAIGSGGSAGTVMGQIPSFHPLPEDEAYVQLSQPLLAEILQFPQERDMAEASAAQWEALLGTISDADNPYREHAVRLGSRAAVLAKRLRRQHGIAARTLASGLWDISTFLEQEMEKVVEIDRKRLELKKLREASAKTELTS